MLAPSVTTQVQAVALPGLGGWVCRQGDGSADTLEGYALAHKARDGEKDPSCQGHWFYPDVLGPQKGSRDEPWPVFVPSGRDWWWCMRHQRERAAEQHSGLRCRTDTDPPGGRSASPVEKVKVCTPKRPSGGGEAVSSLQVDFENRGRKPPSNTTLTGLGQLAPTPSKAFVLLFSQLTVSPGRPHDSWAQVKKNAPCAHSAGSPVTGGSAPAP